MTDTGPHSFPSVLTHHAGHDLASQDIRRIAADVQTVEYRYRRHLSVGDRPYAAF